MVNHVCTQNSQDELKAAKAKTEELQRLSDIYLKQIKFFENTRLELEQQIQTMNSDKTTIMTGMCRSLI